MTSYRPRREKPQPPKTTTSTMMRMMIVVVLMYPPAFARTVRLLRALVCNNMATAGHARSCLRLSAARVALPGWAGAIGAMAFGPR